MADNQLRDRAIALVTGLLCLAALIVTLRTLQQAPRQRTILADKVDRLRELEQLAGGGEDEHAAKAALDALVQAHPPVLADLFGDLLPDNKVTLREQSSRQLESSWFLRQVDVVIPAVEVNRLWQTVQSLEQSRPPWRLRACLVVARPDRPGHADATLSLEALHREDL